MGIAKVFRSHNAGWKFPLFGAVANFVPKNIQQGSDLLVFQIGNLNQGKLVKEALYFREHKVLCVPRLHCGGEDPGGNVPCSVLQVVNLILNVMRFHQFWNVPAATAKQEDGKHKDDEREFTGHSKRLSI